jgi:hypothetical protein
MSNAPNQYNPYAPPQTALGAPQPPGWNPNGGAPLGRIDGKAVVLPNGAPLPAICLKCAANSGLQARKVNFSFVPTWARFFGPLIQVIVMKKSKFELPLCQPCTAQWKRWNLFAWLAAIPGMLLAAIGAAMSDGGLVIAIGVVAMLIPLVTVLVLRKRHVVIASKIDKTHTWLTGLHAEAMRATAGI